MYDFALDLHRHLASEGNLVWSPYSVASALALAAEGARGETRDQLLRALGAAPGELRLAEAAALENAEVAVANTLWMREGLTFENAYQRAIAGFPGAALHTAGFAADPERARQAINTDVAKTTRELISDLLPPGAVNRDTAAVIVNALYLKVAWRHAFGRDATRPGAFHGAGGSRDVPMMRHTEWMPYIEADDWRMVTLPAGDGVVADVLIGEDGEGGGPSPEVLRRLYDSARPAKVALSLPRFRVESRASLAEPLGRLGVATAFTDDADFSGITPEPISVDRVEHKAVLDVDEEGFEGAAATAVAMRLARFDVSSPLEFQVDRPFLVIVRHPATEAVYFVARITDPAAGG
jgi:serine protease inhibitor